MRQRGVSCAQAELSVAASGEATGAELPSIWTGRAHVRARHETGGSRSRTGARTPDRGCEGNCVY